MKLQIDTKEKTIKVEEEVNLEELFSGLKKLFPKDEWKQFKLLTNVTIEWSNPITIPWYPYYPTNPYPWWQPTTIYGTTAGAGGMYTEPSADNYAIGEVVYCVQME